MRIFMVIDDYYMYEKEYKIEELTDQEKTDELIKSIIQTKIDLNNANTNFNYAERELIDYYTYQIKALKSKLDYLTGKAKRRGLVVEIEERAKMINLWRNF